MTTQAPAATYEVTEIFTSLQGEGTRIGMLSTFVRLSRCNQSCAWCLDEDSLVLMGDYTEKRLGDLEVGDVVVAASREEGNQKWVRATVERVSKAKKPCVELTSDRGSLVLTPDHKLWKTERATWAEAQNLVGHDVRYMGRPAVLSDAYLLGYLAGAADGDGTFWTLNKGNGNYRRFRLATNDIPILERVAEALQSVEVDFYWGRHGRTGFSGEYEISDALYVTRAKQAEALEGIIAHDHLEDEAWRTGYLAGLFDTDGTTGGGQSIRWCQEKPRIRERLKRVLEAHGLRYAEEESAIRLVDASPLSSFILELSPACHRKSDPLLFREAKGRAHIMEVKPAGDRTIVTVTTSAGSYVANGFLVKNCDTTYSWKAGEMVTPTVMTPEEILAEVHAPDVVLTGGEPMMQKLEPLLDVLEGRFVTVETNGTMFRPDPRVGLWSVSPKLGSSKQKPNKRVLREYVSQVPDKLQLKFVVGGREDLDAVKALLEELPGATRVPIVIQPVGIPGESRDAYCRKLAALFEQEISPDPFWNAYALRVLPQYHKLLWGEKRGI